MSGTPVLFLDGGLGTSLEDKYGVKFSHDTPLWSSHLLVSGERDVLFACQRDFGHVPVDILLTATYQVSVEAFARTKTPQHPQGIGRADMPTYLEEAVAIAEQAKQPSASIALSLGPYGASMIPSQEYSGQYDAAHDSEESLYQWHLDRLQVFTQVHQLANRTAYVAFETVPRLDEIRAIRRLFRPSGEAATRVVENLPPRYWISCVYPETAALPDGSTIDAVIRALFDPTQGGAVPWAVGINCTKLDKLDAIIRLYEAAITQLVEEEVLPGWPALALYPDGTNGEVYNTETKVWEVQSSQGSPSLPWATRFASLVEEVRARRQWTNLVVGGCCKASSDDIAELRKHLEDDA
ncbi:Homocysteine S-methyltransferase [Microdochium trichocladiopsis]|uniref:Homocysteine S-methyltransferase n=1 Tax=Microdochium trichocladiopsis TaxID=1682393 RepID=A0A9P8Y426_9PEZI|nr:Homocysteine S-methyltransferase [Microdochium trichocladiopsis]KAH7027552.1 Homocysteine S-methyltransferase [Microdochium trichocladiopsis]